MGDHSLGCGKSGDRISRHNMLRDVISRRHYLLIWGRSGKRGICFLALLPDQGMSDGKDGAIDVTVTSPLASSNVAGAEAQAGASLAKACQRKVGDTADACQREGLVFLPFAMETLGGLHPGAVT